MEKLGPPSYNTTSIQMEKTGKELWNERSKIVRLCIFFHLFEKHQAMIDLKHTWRRWREPKKKENLWLWMCYQSSCSSKLYLFCGKEKWAEFFFSLEFANSVMLKYLVERLWLSTRYFRGAHTCPKQLLTTIPWLPRTHQPAKQAALFSTSQEPTGPPFPACETCCFLHCQGCKSLPQKIWHIGVLQLGGTRPKYSGALWQCQRRLPAWQTPDPAVAPLATGTGVSNRHCFCRDVGCDCCGTLQAPVMVDWREGSSSDGWTERLALNSVFLKHGGVSLSFTVAFCK